MTIDRALTIEGYMEPQELRWLAQQASTRRSIIEWGSYLGRSTVAMALNTTGHVWAIDDWAGPRNDGVNTDLKPEPEGGCWAAFRRNTQDIPNITGVQFDHRSWSLLPLLADMVFIDGSHQYEHVRQDLFRFLTCPSQVLLCGHDIDFPTVKKAVDELLPHYAVVEGTSIWYRRL